MKCPTCHGDGYVETTVICGVCGGDGEYVTPDGQMVRCSNCNGSGEVATSQDCPTCGGTGSI